MKKNKFIIISFLTVIFGVFLLIPTKFLLVKLSVLDINYDNFSEYQAKEENNLIDKLNNYIGKIENQVENHVTNYFPFYNSLNESYQKIDFYSNRFFYHNVPIKKNSDGEYIFYNKRNDFYYLLNKYPKLVLDDKVKKQVRFFNELSKKDIDMYIYLPVSYEYTNLISDNLSSYVTYFKNNLNDNIHIKVMNINSLEEYKNFYYKTDHHWTINGALSGYYDITNMLKVSSLENLTIEEKKDKKFYGSMAKTALNDVTYDYIKDVTINLNYDVLVNEKSAPEIFKPRKIRLDRNYKYYDYYVQYFNGQYGNVIYDYHDNTKENLLIIGDSYVWQIDYLIASSFNKTHVINLRYDEYKNNNFNLTNYVKENNIHKVLFLYDSGSTLFDELNYNLEGRIK